MKKAMPKPDFDSTSRVTFDLVTVYEFPLEIGDNPAVREGCPIRLGDKLLREITTDVDSYEKERCPRQRNAKRLYIQVTDRAAM